jgi:hypothetical protein
MRCTVLGPGCSYLVARQFAADNLAENGVARGVRGGLDTTLHRCAGSSVEIQWSCDMLLSRYSSAFLPLFRESARMAIHSLSHRARLLAPQ